MPRRRQGRTAICICCLEISADDWYNDGPEEMVKDSIYMVSSGNTEPFFVPDGTEPDGIEYPAEGAEED